MLKPVTARMTDESEGNIYRFTFYCDLCGAPRQSETYESRVAEDAGTDSCERITDHHAAYERANFEALHYFNRCPVCKRMVCDDCYNILDKTDMCKKCAEAL